MKHRAGVVSIAVVFLCMLSAVACFAANEVTADSRITQVMVFPDAALLTRSASFKLSAGEYKVLFADILPELDENSLRVSADAQSGVKIIGAQLKREFLPEVPSEKIKQLKDEIQKLQDEMRMLQNLKTIFSEEKEFLNSLRFFSKDQLPEELATKMPAPKDLDDTLKFLDSKLRENYSGVMDCEVKTRELAVKLDVLKREMEQISSLQRKMKRNIVVELIAEKNTQCVLEVSYLVGGASWQPIYDARADFNKGVVELVSHGIVSQKTGEDWNDVSMALSTARPTVGGRMPELTPWFLRPFQPHVLMENTRGGFDKYAAKAMKAEMASFSEEDAGMMLAPSVPLYAKAQEKGVAVVYTLPRKAEVKSDGSEHKLLVSSQMLESDFEYSTYPRVSPTVYLRSKVTNAKDLQLLAGRVNIFLEGDFVGASHIDSIGPGEKFDLYLGLDENVKIKRDLVEKKIDETFIGNILSPTKKTIFKYKLTVENYKTRNSKIKLFEAMPIPEDDRIKIKMGQVSLEPKVKDWEDKKGIWLWEFELAPKAKQEITYTYTIEHPREMQVEGL